MRALLLAFLIASPAATQDFGFTTQAQIDDLRMQQQLAQQRAIAQSNELMALESRLRTEQAVRDLEFQRALPPRLPQLPYPAGAPPARIDTSKLPSIPDAALADSNRRVRDASENRR